MSDNSPVTQTREQKIEERIDTNFAREIAISSRSGGGSSFAPTTMGEAMEFAKIMSVAGPMVGKSFRGNPGACLGISMQAWRWGMDPFAVSQKAYTTGNGDNGIIGYEAQLVSAVINTCAPIEGRPSFAYEGDGDNLVCTVTVKLRDDPEPKTLVSPPFGQITPKNSPLWKSNPRQQLAYHTIRNWARLYVPEIIMGVYDTDEAEEIARAERAKDVTPKAERRAEAMLDKFTAAVQTPAEPDLATIAEDIQNRMEAAETTDELAGIWFEASQAGVIDRIRRESPERLEYMATFYNCKREAFDQDARAATKSEAEIVDDISDETIEMAVEYTRTALAELSDLKTAKAINTWFDTSFADMAQRMRLSDAQIKIVEDQKNERIKALTK